MVDQAHVVGAESCVTTRGHRLNLHPRKVTTDINNAVVSAGVAVGTRDAPSAAQHLGGKAHLCPLAFLFGEKFCGHGKEIKTAEDAKDAKEPRFVSAHAFQACEQAPMATALAAEMILFKE